MTDRHDAREPDGAEAAEPIEPTHAVDTHDAETTVDAVHVEDSEHVEDAEATEDAPPDERTERRSDVVIVTLVFVVLFGFQLYTAVSNLVGLPQLYDQIGIAGSVPWAVLYAGVGVPAVVFAAASAVARGRRIAARAGLFLLGLGVSAQLSLLLEELARQAAVVAFGG